MLLVVAGNVVGALVLGQVHGLLALAAPAALGASLLAGAVTFWLRGTLGSRLMLAAVLVVLIALQIHLAGGLLVYHFNVFVSLSILLAYRDWRPIVFMAGLFAVHHVAFDRMLQAGIGTYCLSAPDPQQIMLHLAFVVVQASVLSAVAVVQNHEARSARELEFLVKTMGRDGKVLLNLDVIRAETPIGQRLQHVQQRMVTALRTVHAAAAEVDAAAKRVAGGSNALMTRTDATASGLRDAAMCLDQINVIVKHSTEASNEAKVMSDTAAGIADQGGRLVGDVVRTMKDIEASSNRISDIIAVIDGIAFQTNILALNAAVEAARAGEQGRGFAVVASEVRSLASRSAAAAKEIKGLIGASASTVESGTRQVGEAGQTMNELVGSVRRVGALFDAVTADTSDHMQSLNMVSQSMTELGEITRQNVSLAEETDSAAAALQALATNLTEVLNSFAFGQGAAQPAAPVAEVPRSVRPPPAPAASGKVAAGRRRRVLLIPPLEAP